MKVNLDKVAVTLATNTHAVRQTWMETVLSHSQCMRCITIRKADSLMPDT